MTLIEDCPAHCHRCRRRRRRRRQRQTAGSSASGSATTGTACIFGGMFLLARLPAGVTYVEARLSSSSSSSSLSSIKGTHNALDTTYLTENHIRSIRDFDPANPPPLPLQQNSRDLQSQSQTQTPTEQAKCRPLQISEWIRLLQTETNSEYDLTQEVAEMADVDPSLLLARAQLMWEDTTNFEWTRSLDASSASDSSSGGNDGSTPAPFVVCLEQSAPRGNGGRIVSGFRRRKIVRDAIRSTIGDVLDRVDDDRWVYRDTILRTLYNGDDMLCSYVLMDSVVAQELSFDGCVVQPMTMSMKLMPRTIDLLLEKARDCQEEINGRKDEATNKAVVGRNNNGRQLELELELNQSGDIRVQVDKGGKAKDDRQTRRSGRRRTQGTVLDLLLGGGDGDDGDENDEKNDQGGGANNDNDNGGSNGILDGLPDCDALDLDRPSADIIMCPGSLSYNQLTALQEGDPSYLVASLISKKGDQASSIPEQVFWTSSAAEPYRRMESSRSEYWKRALTEAGSERCDEVFRTRLQWSVRPGTDDTRDFAALRVVYDASTAETWESACVGTLIAGLAVRQDVCGVEITAELGTTNYNANWMVQSGVKGETPLTDIGLDGSGQVVGLSDTGIDVQNCYFHDADFGKPTEDLDTNGHRKIAQYRAYADDKDEELGHGTHGKCYRTLHVISTYVVMCYEGGLTFCV